jgi:dihydroceramidase
LYRVAVIPGFGPPFPSPPKMMITVRDKTQNITGYWGPVDTTTTFCEQHYSLSPFFAEFFNAWSSIVFIIVGAYLIRKFRGDTWVRIAALWLALIGIGSFAFHATMRYSMQLLDELPMVGFISTVILAKTMSKDHKGIEKYATYIQIWVSLQAVMLVTVYLYFELYQIFIDGFTFMVINDVVVGHLLASRGPHQKMKRKVQTCALGFIILGRVAWETENQLCGTYPTVVWPLHSVWHFLSVASAYNTCIFVCLCRIGANDKIPALIGYNTTKAKDE